MTRHVQQWGAQMQVQTVPELVHARQPGFHPAIEHALMQYSAWRN